MHRDASVWKHILPPRKRRDVHLSPHLVPAGARTIVILEWICYRWNLLLLFICVTRILLTELLRIERVVPGPFSSPNSEDRIVISEAPPNGEKSVSCGLMDSFISQLYSFLIIPDVQDGGIQPSRPQVCRNSWSSQLVKERMIKFPEIVSGAKSILTANGKHPHF